MSGIDAGAVVRHGRQEAPLQDGPVRRRLPGPDVVRAVALIGVVVMNYHGYLLIRGGTQGDDAIDRIFDPWGGPLSTRFAATFVLVAGVGVTLLTRSLAAGSSAMASMRWRLVRRGLLLYVVGVVFDIVWSGTILPFYGAMFVIGGVIVAWRGRWVLTVGAVSAAAGAAIAWWRFERQLDGYSTAWLEGDLSSPRAALFDVFVDGTHPLLPWLAFFSAGIVLGRVLGSAWWRATTFATGAVLWTVATIVSEGVAAADRGSGLATMLASSDPNDRGLAYTSSALATALIAFAAISWVADRYTGRAAVELLRVTGQMSLSLYVLHALVFNLLVDWWEWVRPTGLDTALTFALIYWILGLGGAWLWSRRFTRGPFEIVYRQLTA